MKAILFPFGPTEASVQLTRDFSELDWTVVASPEDVARAAPGATIYVTSNRTCKPATGDALRRHGQALRWMHFTSAGIDNGIAMGIPDGVLVSNSSGIKAGMVSEHAILLLLAAVRRLHVVASAQRRHEWLRAEFSRQMTTLEGAVVCVVGRGAIGRELARKLKAIGASPIAVSRDTEPDGVVEQVFPRARLQDALAMANAVVICTGGGDDTRELIGAREFAAMQPGAVLVNVARGSIVDEAALIAALNGGRLAVAGLDVVATEPMPADNVLWDMPNVIITPHVAGQGSTGYPEQRRLFAENLRRFKAGEPLLNACKIPRGFDGDRMTLIINNHDVEQVLTMEDTLAALEEAYLQLAAREAVCRPRIDIRIPTSNSGKNYQWGTMEGGSTAGYFAIRMKSDIIYETEYNGVLTQEKYCTRPGLFCGLILLTSIENGEPLAFLNDGHLQHMRVGADGGIGVKYLANEDAEVVGIIGSGGMARTHMQAFTRVRTIKKLQVFSPTRENREKFGREMAAKYNIEVKVCDRPEDIYKGAHIVAALTNSALQVTDGSLLEKGAHIVVVGGTGRPDDASLAKVDVYLRFGDTPAPVGHPELATDAEHLGYEARPLQGKHGDGRRSRRKHGNALPDKRVTLADLVQGRAKGRTSSAQITYSERGNLQGAQFFAVAGKVYEAVKRAGLGREIPTEWFLQDIRN